MLTKRLRGYGRDESQDDWELMKAEAFWERLIAVSGDAFVGASRRGSDILVILGVQFVVIAPSWSCGDMKRKPPFERSKARTKAA
jgi:hypothetical protein